MTDDFHSFIKSHKNIINECANRFQILDLKQTDDISKATHWRPLSTPSIPTSTGVTVGKVYRLYYDKVEKEEMIVDDNGNFSLIYMCHNGEFLVYDA